MNKKNNFSTFLAFTRRQNLTGTVRVTTQTPTVLRLTTQGQIRQVTRGS